MVVEQEAILNKKYKGSLILGRLMGVWIDLELAYEKLKERNKISILETYHYLQVAQVNALGAFNQCDGLCGGQASTLESLSHAIKRNADELGEMLYESRLLEKGIEDFLQRISGTKKITRDLAADIENEIQRELHDES